MGGGGIWFPGVSVSVRCGCWKPAQRVAMACGVVDNLTSLPGSCPRVVQVHRDDPNLSRRAGPGSPTVYNIAR